MEQKKLNPEQGKRLKDCIAEAGMNQKGLAEKCHYSSQYISYIINGKKHLTYEAAAHFSKALNVRADYLLCNDDYKTEDDKRGNHTIMSQAYDDVFNSLLIIAGNIYIKRMITASNQFPLQESVLSDKKLYLKSSNEALSNYTRDSGFSELEFWATIEHGGIEKMLPREYVFSLVEDIKDYATFKCQQFLKAHWENADTLENYLLEHNKHVIFSEPLDENNEAKEE